MRLIKSYFLLTILLLLPYAFVTAEEAKITSVALPDPLTLDLALSLIDQRHPNLRYADANLQISNSNLQQALSSNDLSLSLKANARWIEPSALSSTPSNKDHRLGLFANKTLYDFGRSSSQIDAANNSVLSEKFQYLNASQHQYLEVMKRYFDVVLADLQFYRYNEEMAVAYIRFDRRQIRAKLGQYTEVDVAEKEVEYQRIRRLRTYSENQQRVTRSLLAQSLNKPESLPTTVTKPELNIVSRKLPEFEKIVKQVKDRNPILRALRAQLAAAKNNVQYAHSSHKPKLTGELETFGYEVERSSSDKWRAQITLDIPLWSGGRVDAAVAKAKAEVYRIEAQLAEQELIAQQKVLELWLGINTLKVQYDEVLAGMNFSELSLDKNRALYELEVQADLGYSMVEFSAAEREVVKTSFDMALAWAELDALSGTLLNKTNK